ncbi:uncharacterized protein LOC112556904 isoform X2 [Pomacea canaliculata]|uniref:uncharacterized protein LOC112556904 isoform X2 n=1 Tax=Pomacea canaliculata TaxID=400727 RepID=UPI000D72FF99|nr:uncharacterized protein LOC112556904 isoform X2 [Pomacea canaliculata]
MTARTVRYLFPPSRILNVLMVLLWTQWMNGCECEGRRLYWAAADTQLIGWTDLDDRNTEVYFKYQGSFFMGLDIYQTDLFVTDWGPKKHLANTTHIYRIGENGTIRATVQVKGRVNDVRVYAEERIHTVSTSSALTSDQTTRSETTEAASVYTAPYIKHLCTAIALLTKKMGSSQTVHQLHLPHQILLSWWKTKWQTVHKGSLQRM